MEFIPNKSIEVSARIEEECTQINYFIKLNISKIVLEILTKYESKQENSKCKTAVKF